MENGVVHITNEGTPQGGIISPLLANIYLNEFDWWMDRKYLSLSNYLLKKRGKPSLIYVRYADDWVIMARGTKTEARDLKEKVISFLEDTLQLKVNKDKTKITHSRDSFNFLGYTLKSEISGKGFKERAYPSKQAIESFRRSIKTLTRKDSIHQEPYMKFVEISRVVRGWAAYFKWGNVHEQFAALTWYTNQRVIRWLQNKHKGKSYEWIKKKYYGKTPEGYVSWRVKLGDKIYFVPALRTVKPTTYLNKIPSEIRIPPEKNPYIKNTGITLQPIPYTSEIRARPPKDHLINWWSIRRRTINRDRHKCNTCGTSRDLHTHRVVGNTKTRHTTLCQQCHQKVTKQTQTKDKV